MIHSARAHRGVPVIGPVVLVALSVAACGAVDGPGGGTVCATYAAAGINATLTDSVSGATFPFDSVRVVAAEGGYRDSVYVGAVTEGGRSVGLVYERAGVYTVTVRARGYQPWTRSAVTVRAGTCHVEPVALTARLVR